MRNLYRFGKIAASGMLVLFFLTVSNGLAGQLSRTVMKVSKLSCGACLAQINAELKKLPEFDGMGSNLGQGIVAVDHKPALEAKKIAAVITGLGYPARVVREMRIDEKQAFSSRQQPGGSGGCCGTRGTVYKKSQRNNADRYGGPAYPGQSCSGSAACGGIGPGSSRSCGAGASAWQQLFGKSRERTKTDK